MLDGCLAVADVATSRAAHRPGHGRARAGRDRPVEKRDRAVIVTGEEGADVPTDRQHLRILIPFDQLERPLGVAQPSGGIGDRIGRPHLADPEDVPVGRVGMGRGVVRDRARSPAAAARGPGRTTRSPSDRAGRAPGARSRRRSDSGAACASPVPAPALGRAARWSGRRSPPPDLAARTARRGCPRTDRPG